ncbi:MAG: Ig-like domain-containing protein [Eubacteriales bacterium]
MIKKTMAIFLVVAFVVCTFPVNSINIAKAAEITDNTGWVTAYPENNQNDYLQDQQTGSGSVSQDIVGDASNPSTYMRFSSTEIDFRIRISNINGTSPYEFKNFAFIGIDSDVNGSVDFFLGIYNPTGNNGRLGIYDAAAGYENLGPSTTGISGKPLMAFAPDSGVNFDISDAPTNFNGDPDYYISFKFSMSDIADALQGTGHTFTSSTPFRFMTGTAAQDNSFNQDLNGMDQTGFSSDETWNDLNVFSDIVTADGSTSYYLVVFDKNTGDTESVPQTMAVEANQTLGSLPTVNPTKRGMYFQEWNTMPDGSGDTVTADYVVTSDAIFYAIWSDTPLMTVTFYPEGGDWTGSTTPIIVQTIDGIVDGNMPIAPTKTGDYFMGWEIGTTGEYFNSSTDVENAPGFDTINLNLDVYAQWANNATNVAVFYDNFDASGGSEVARVYSNGASSNFNSDMPGIDRPGYTFDGWYLYDPVGGTYTYSGIAGSSIPSAGEYYAMWSPATYNLTFNENYGATPAESTQPVTGGVVGTMPADPVRAGYEFIEWNRLTDGTGEPIYPTTEISSDTTVYAIWKQILSVTFYSNGGEFDGGATSWGTTAVDNQLDLFPQPPFRTDYSFIGWGTTPGSTTPVNLLTVDYTVYNQLYAIWVPVNHVTFSENYGPAPGTTDVLTAYGSVLYIPEDPTRAGYTFIEWNTQPDGTGSEFKISSDVTGDIIIYAKWNAIPTANDDSAATAVDTPVNIDVLSNDLDTDTGDTLSVVSAINGANGTVTINGDGTINYSPTLGFTGTDTFTYTISDGNGGTDTATVTVYVGINAPPTAVDDAYSTDEDTTLTVAAPGVMTNDSDIDGTITAALNADVSNGTLAFNPDGSFEYIPDADFNGSDSFTYTITDNSGATATATVTITVNSVNDVPSAVDDSYSTPQDTALNVAAPGVMQNDSMGDAPSSIALTTNVSNGLLAFNADGSFDYTPNAGFSGNDSFIYTITDADNETSTATVTITVNSSNLVPAAIDDTYSTAEDTTLNIAASGVLSNDTLGDGINVLTVTDDVDNGTLTLNQDGSFEYIPNSNFNGTDTFTYQIEDEDNETSTATVTINVTPVDETPTAGNDSATTNEDTAVIITYGTNDSNPDGGGSIAVDATSTAGGTIIDNGDGTFTYTPAANFNGTDTFGYSITDGDGDIDSAVITVTVSGVNDTPTAGNDSATTNEDTAVTITYGTNDSNPDGGGSISVDATSAQGGTIVDNGDGTFTYTPPANFNGTDTFGYSITDGDGDTDSAVITVTVNSINDTPTAGNDNATTDEDTAVTITYGTNDSNPDGGGSIAVDATSTAGGTIVDNADGTFTYTPAANFNGTDTFGYTITDGDGDTDSAVITVTVNSINDTPTAGDDSSTTDEDTSVTITYGTNDRNPDGGGSISVDAASAQGGTIVDNGDGTFTYTPSLNFYGTDTFTYSITDGDGDNSTATITITVNAVDEVPTAIDDVTTTNEDTAVIISYVLNDSNPDGGGSITVDAVSTAGGSIADNNNGTFTYTPLENFNGTDTFGYTITDGDGDFAAATITITIDPVEDAPIADDDNGITIQGVPLLIRVLDNDNDPDGDTLSVTIASGPSRGTALINLDGSITYTPFPGFRGIDSITYVIADGNGGTATATIFITINGVTNPATGDTMTIVDYIKYYISQIFN